MIQLLASASVVRELENNVFGMVLVNIFEVKSSTDSVWNGSKGPLSWLYASIRVSSEGKYENVEGKVPVN